MKALDLPNITLFTGLTITESIIISILLPTATDPTATKDSRRLLIYSIFEPFLTRNALLNRIRALQKANHLTKDLIPTIDPTDLHTAMPSKNIQSKSGRPCNS